jgi:hypothetical protein
MEHIMSLREKLLAVKNSKHSALMHEVAKEIEELYKSHVNSVLELESCRHALADCEEVRTKGIEALSAVSTMKTANERLQSEVLVSNQRLKQAEEDSWSNFAVVFVATVAFFGGMAMTMLFIPVLSMAK